MGVISCCQEVDAKLDKAKCTIGKRIPAGFFVSVIAGIISVIAIVGSILLNTLKSCRNVHIAWKAISIVVAFGTVAAVGIIAIAGCLSVCAFFADVDNFYKARKAP